jgi:microcompartment protein CcmL/EutN
MSPTQNQSCESLRQNPPTLPPISVNHISNVLTDSVAVTPRPKEDVKVILTDKEMDKELEKELAELGGVIENIKTKNVGKVLEVIETNKEEEKEIEIQNEEG